MAEPVLTIKNLKTYFIDSESEVRAVDGIDIDLFPGQTLCVVGESGCGKSVTALSVMGLLPRPKGKIVDGQIVFEGIDTLKVGRKGAGRNQGK